VQFNLDLTIEILRRTPATLRSLLHGLSEPWIAQNEGEGTWSPHDIVGHLIHGEHEDWIPRTRIILESGAEKPFAPFDVLRLTDYSKGKSLSQLLDEFERLRIENLEILSELNLQPYQLELKGQHPTFGDITLRQLLSTWAVHDLSHIAQISRVMAKQYASEVGPWSEFLPILRRKRG